MQYVFSVAGKLIHISGPHKVSMVIMMVIKAWKRRWGGIVVRIFDKTQAVEKFRE